MPSDVRIADGQLSWSGGVDSGRTPTIASETYPEGLGKTQLSWLVNGTVRGGGITPRFGWRKIVEDAPWNGLYQGGAMYEPDFANPYMMLLIGGRTYLVRTDLQNQVQDVTDASTVNPPNEPQAFFCQGEQFMVIQAGDLVTNPLIWDGVHLTRSAGLTGSPRELPPAGPMDYYAGRLWYAIGRKYTAGDIVGGPSGRAMYNFRDSILRVTENPLAIGGDGFIVPTNAGNIRALKHTANLDTALGQGPLYVFTRRAIYASQPPVTRNAWIAATADAPPIQTVAQLRYGSYGDRSIVAENGDLFYQSTDGIRSLFIAIRYFQQWGNTPISRNENRVIVYNNRALMRYASGIDFDNRLLQTVLPIQTPVGVAFQGIIPLDFDLISSFGKKEPPAWEGLWEGLDVLQLMEGDYGGLQRAFAVVHSRLSGKIEVWELTLSERFENGDNRNTMIIDFPAFTWNDLTTPKQLRMAELWVDRLFGTVEFKLYYRPDQNPCWYKWLAWQECASRSPCEDLDGGPCIDYPTQQYCEQYRTSMKIGEPPIYCDPSFLTPTNIGFQFQFRLVVHGWARIRGLMVHATMKEDPPFEGIRC